MEEEIQYESLYSNPEIREVLGELAYPEKEVKIITVELDRRTVIDDNTFSHISFDPYTEALMHFFKQNTGCYLQMDKTDKYQKESSNKRRSKRSNIDLSKSQSKENSQSIKLEHFKLFNLPSHEVNFFFSKSIRERRYVEKYSFFDSSRKIQHQEPVPSKCKHCLVLLNAKFYRFFVEQRYHCGFEFFIKPQALCFHITTVDKFICSLSLYNINTLEKLSENFTFIITTQNDPNEETNCESSAIFHIDSPLNNNIYLVLTIDKVLTGSLDYVYDCYSKKYNSRDKDYLKHLQETNIAQHESKYYQHFLYSMAPLFNNGIPSNISGCLKLTFQRVKSDLNSFIEEFSKKKDKKYPPIPGHLKLNLLYDIPQMNRLNSSNVRVRPYTENAPVTIEIQYFYPESPSYPLTDYINNIFFYPGKLTLDSTVGSYRNISIEIKVMTDDINIEDVGMEWIYSRECRELQATRYTSVWYHNNKPRFNDEIKISLPVKVPKKTHLVLTFLHISCSPKPDKAKLSASPFAYTVIPLFNNEVLSKGNFDAILVPIGAYRRYVNDTEFFSRKRGTLEYQLLPCTSLIPQDLYLGKILDSSSASRDPEIFKNVDPGQAINFIYHILYFSLLQIAKNSDSDILNIVFCSLTKAASKFSIELEEAMKTFAYFLYDEEFDAMCPKMYINLIKHWIQLLNNYLKSSSMEGLLYGWFIQQIIIKSLAFELKRRNLLESTTNRIHYFENEFYKHLENWIRITSGIIRYSIRTYDSHGVERCVAIYTSQFISSLYKLVNRDKVHNLVSIFFKELSIHYDSAKMMGKNADTLTTFFLILAEKANFYPLNLPIIPEFTSGMEMLELFSKKHYLIGIYTKSFKRALNQPFMQTRITYMHGVLQMFKMLLLNENLQEKTKKKVISIFWPIVYLLIEKWHSLSQSFQEKILVIAIIFFCISNAENDIDIKYCTHDSWINVNTLFQILSSALQEFSLKKEDSFSMDETVQRRKRLYFLSELLFSSAVEEDSLKSTIKKKSTKRINLSESTYEYSTTNSRNRAYEYEENFTYGNTSHIQLFCEFCQVVASIAMNFLLKFVKFFSPVMDRRDIIDAVWSPLLIIVSSDPTIDVKLNTLQTMHSFIDIFGSNLFMVKNNVFNDLINFALEYSANVYNRVSDSAKSLIMKIIEINYRVFQNIDFISSHFMVTCIKSVGSSSKTLDISIYNFVFESAREAFPVLKPSIDALQEKINGIYETDVKMHKYHYNKEIMAELYYSLSKQFSQSPDECITWLESLAQMHKNNDDLQEFAQVSIIMAVYVKKYSMINGDDSRLLDDVNFGYVSPNIENNELFKFKTLDSELSSIQSSYFKVNGYLELMKRAVTAFFEGSYHEHCLQGYRLILPLYYRLNQYSKLLGTFQEQEVVCKKLIEEKEGQNRISLNYYRVALLGKRVNEKAYVEYIYKELPTMRLIEFKDEIVNKLNSEYEESNIEILGNNVTDFDQFKDDQFKVYFQICNVEPQNDDLFNGYDKHFRLNKFVMDQPFTKSGKPHADLDQQYIRRTIFTTEGYFPGPLKRLQITNKIEQIITPIECAIELIKKRTESLRNELANSKVNVKNIERELTGTVLTQVNVGMFALIETFLSSKNADSYSIEHREVLTQSVLDFEKAVNFSLIFIKRLDTVKPELLNELTKGINKLHSFISMLPFTNSYKKNIDLLSSGKKDDFTLGEEMEKRLAAKSLSEKTDKMQHPTHIALDHKVSSHPKNPNFGPKVPEFPQSLFADSNEPSSQNTPRQPATSHKNDMSESMDPTLRVFIEELKKRILAIISFLNEIFEQVQNCQKSADILPYVKIWKELKENMLAFLQVAPQIDEIKGYSTQTNSFLKAQDIMKEEISIAKNILTFTIENASELELALIKPMVPQVKKLEAIIKDHQFSLPRI